MFGLRIGKIGVVTKLISVLASTFGLLDDTNTNKLYTDSGIDLLLGDDDA